MEINGFHSKLITNLGMPAQKSQQTRTTDKAPFPESFNFHFLGSDASALRERPKTIYH